jgi:glycosyltransferase involved in cell wall biosynthesis
MKNILIVNCVFDPEPVVSAQIGHSLSETLSESGHNVTVIAPYPSRPLGFNFEELPERANRISIFISKKQLTCYHLPSYIHPESGILGRLRESISFGIASYKFIMSSKDKYDIVYMNTWPIFGQLGVAFACLRKNVPYAIHIMDIYPESLTKSLPLPIKAFLNLLLMPVEKFILRKAKLIIAISNKMKKYLFESRNLEPSKIAVIHNWQDENNFTDIPRPIKNEKKVFMYLGNIGPVAGIPFLIEGFSNLNGKLIIAGMGSERENCKRMSEKYPNLDVEFLDVPNGKVAEIQSLADVMLLPILKGTANTSIPSKLPAYMFSKKPVIVMADNDCDSALAVLDAKCGWVGDYGDLNKLEYHVNQILSFDDEQLQKMGLNGCDYAKENFSKRKNLDKLKFELLQ